MLVVIDIACRLATFYSRSRQERWCKGETSGNFISVKGIFLDCDRDSVIYLADPSGPSCHTVSILLFGAQCPPDISDDEFAIFQSNTNASFLSART